eukprot:TRINITY_DN13042_c0_g1_i1.p1 TRINITY_DN13042_c0_g1~~TRINITY_DN13042_c0_g1_i1.p1  ORF type:complete len:436 (+),score=58.74 TRINITY_DN13042_c0_g1_i1:62-1309(+)
MSTSKGHGVKSDIKKSGWEDSAFPIVCETCLGDNPYVRMTKAPFNKECKVCDRPFTVFRWRPGTNARFKKTEICQTCSKMKNVCQVCLLDLEYGLPVQVRDTMEPSTAEPIPQSEVNREWFADQNERRLESGLQNLGKGSSSHPMLAALARDRPRYKRNLPHICSFWVKGECKRGKECPYRHEKPIEGDLAHQNIKDRYYGVNDPVAKKMLGRASNMNKAITPPVDKDVMTLWVGGVQPDMTESQIRDKFYAYGEVREIRMAPRANCAFVTYTTRADAEVAAEKLFRNLNVNGVPLRVAWGKPQQQVDTGGSSGGSSSASSGPSNFFNLPGPGSAAPAANNGPPGLLQRPSLGYGPRSTMPGVAAPSSSLYPSMNPSAQGTRPEQQPNTAGGPMRGVPRPNLTPRVGGTPYSRPQ